MSDPRRPHSGSNLAVASRYTVTWPLRGFWGVWHQSVESCGLQVGAPIDWTPIVNPGGAVDPFELVDAAEVALILSSFGGLAECLFHLEISCSAELCTVSGWSMLFSSAVSGYDSVSLPATSFCSASSCFELAACKVMNPPQTNITTPLIVTSDEPHKAETETSESLVMHRGSFSSHRMWFLWGWHAESYLSAADSPVNPPLQTGFLGPDRQRQSCYVYCGSICQP